MGLGGVQELMLRFCGVDTPTRRLLVERGQRAGGGAQAAPGASLHACLFLCISRTARP